MRDSPDGVDQDALFTIELHGLGEGVDRESSAVRAEGTAEGLAIPEGEDSGRWGLPEDSFGQ